MRVVKISDEVRQRWELVDRLAEALKSALNSYTWMTCLFQTRGYIRRAMSPNPTTENAEEHKKALAALHPRERMIVEDVMAQHPNLTVAEAIEACKAGGM